jgi:hypothetical protein
MFWFGITFLSTIIVAKKKSEIMLIAALGDDRLKVSPGWEMVLTG